MTKKRNFKYIAITLCLALVVSLIPGMAFADSYNITEGEMDVVQLTEQSYLLTENGKTSTMQIEESLKEGRVTITDAESGTVKGQIVWDKSKNTIYSSYTGKTVSLGRTAFDEGGLSPNAIGDVVNKEVKISYKKLNEMVLPTTDTIGIAAIILTIIAAKEGVTLGVAASVLLGLGSTSFWGEIRKNIIKGTSPGGVVVKYQRETIGRHQGGNIVPAYRYKFVSIGTYK